MNKSLIILTLAILQCACAGQVDVQPPASSLLSFAAISAEISVAYEKTEAADDLSEAIALNSE